MLLQILSRLLEPRVSLAGEDLNPKCLPVFPNVEELGSDEQGDVIRRKTEEDFITSAIKRCVVRAIYLFACR